MSAHWLTEDRPERTLPVAALLITAAGMLDAFTYVGYGGVFANAMTGNIVILTVHLAKGELGEVLPFFAPVIAYVLGVGVAHLLKRNESGWFKATARAALSAEIAFLVVVAFLPRSVPDMLVVAGIAFVAALQATAFTRIAEFAYTSVTTSSNLRRFAESAISALVFKEGRRAAREAMFFAILVVCFIGGALIGAAATEKWGHGAVWLPIGCLTLALALCLPWNLSLRGIFGRDE
ncbi:YoaK family protein [Asticcacaulis sp. 201]|uniref:YoaK family protein n=1 Tax=Asticcacaulis sp. 201 TaxID=3028787 RepID=UPI002916DF1C|nr:YoaK family protein [Asticcacaulis sp. 201]MDV6332659.1 YoaK family protein [Asticcacaulis sp. 201]